MQAKLEALTQTSQRLAREVQAAEAEQQSVYRQIAKYDTDCMLLSVQNQGLLRWISFLSAVSPGQPLFGNFLWHVCGPSSQSTSSLQWNLGMKSCHAVI